MQLHHGQRHLAAEQGVQLLQRVIDGALDG
jgi:hypothetical protein